MKNIFAFFALILTISLFTACNSPKGEKVEAEEAQTENTATPADAVAYKVDTQASNIVWTGSKPTGQHTGNLKLSGGELMVAGNNITGGKFTIDMNSLENTDLKAGEGKEDLEGHLKTGDFFQTDKYPTGTFTVTNVAAVSGDASVTHNVTGNLQMKGITKSVTIPVNVAIMGDKISAQSKAFKIDRTEWGINYNSGSLADTAKDKVINDDIGLVITLVANK